jgi:hypothetical protein
VRAWLFALLLACPCVSLGQGHPSNFKFIDGHPVSYSNMYVVEEEGVFFGLDLRVTKLSDKYHVTLFCGEGKIQGPVHATFRLKDGTTVIHPDNKVCGATLELRFEAGGVRIKVGDGDLEFVPQHKNFIKEERWK